MNKITRFFLTNIASIISILSYGFVLTKLWTWFIVPTFHLIPLTLVQAIGLFLVVNLIRPVLHSIDIEYLEDEDVRTKIGYFYIGVNLVYPWLTLLTGWLVHLFMPV